jgi:hypothetical protein
MSSFVTSANINQISKKGIMGRGAKGFSLDANHKAVRLREGGHSFIQSIQCGEGSKSTSLQRVRNKALSVRLYQILDHREVICDVGTVPRCSGEFKDKHALTAVWNRADS